MLEEVQLAEAFNSAQLHVLCVNLACCMLEMSTLDRMQSIFSLPPPLFKFRISDCCRRFQYHSSYFNQCLMKSGRSKIFSYAYLINLEFNFFHSIPPLSVVGLSEEQAIEQAKGDISVFTSTFNPMKNSISGYVIRHLTLQLISFETNYIYQFENLITYNVH